MNASTKSPKEKKRVGLRIQCVKGWKTTMVNAKVLKLVSQPEIMGFLWDFD